MIPCTHWESFQCLCSVRVLYRLSSKMCYLVLCVTEGKDTFDHRLSICRIGYGWKLTWTLIRICTVLQGISPFLLKRKINTMATLVLHTIEHVGGSMMYYLHGSQDPDWLYQKLFLPLSYCDYTNHVTQARPHQTRNFRQSPRLSNLGVILYCTII